MSGITKRIGVQAPASSGVCCFQAPVLCWPGSKHHAFATARSGIIEVQVKETFAQVVARAGLFRHKDPQLAV